MLLIKEQISSVYRNKSSITFPHVKVYRGFMCFSGKRRKYSCFGGNNSLFYVLFSLTVIALTWKLSWHVKGNKNVKRMPFAEPLTCLAPSPSSMAEGICSLIQKCLINASATNLAGQGSLLMGQPFQPSNLQCHCEATELCTRGQYFLEGRNRNGNF